MESQNSTHRMESKMLGTVARCTCGHSFFRHCEEDEWGLFVADHCKKSCKCKKYEPAMNDPEVIEVAENGFVPDVKVSK